MKAPRSVAEILTQHKFCPAGPDPRTDETWLSLLVGYCRRPTGNP